MSAWAQSYACSGSLTGLEGELVWVRISVEPRLLERLLDSLSGLPFPVNPEIQHSSAAHHHPVVEFPAFSHRLTEIDGVLRGARLATACVSVEDMLARIRTH